MEQTRNVFLGFVLSNGIRILLDKITSKYAHLPSHSGKPRLGFRSTNYPTTFAGYWLLVLVTIRKTVRLKPTFAQGCRPLCLLERSQLYMISTVSQDTFFLRHFSFKFELAIHKIERQTPTTQQSITSKDLKGCQQPFSRKRFFGQINRSSFHKHSQGHGVLMNMLLFFSSSGGIQHDIMSFYASIDSYTSYVHNSDVIRQPAYAVVQQLFAENDVRLFPHILLKGG